MTKKPIPRRLLSVSKFGVIAGAGALVLYGLSRRNKTGVAIAAAGGLLAYRQARSHPQSSGEAASAVFRVSMRRPLRLQALARLRTSTAIHGSPGERPGVG